MPLRRHEASLRGWELRLRLLARRIASLGAGAANGGGNVPGSATRRQVQHTCLRLLVFVSSVEDSKTRLSMATLDRKQSRSCPHRSLHCSEVATIIRTGRNHGSKIRLQIRAAARPLDRMVSGGEGKHQAVGRRLSRFWSSFWMAIFTQMGD